MAKLEGRVAIVTGATRGIGRATAFLLAGERATVVITGIDDADGEQTAREIRKKGGKAHYLHHDVTSEQDWSKVLTFTIGQLGRLDVLVNNAGVFIYKPLNETTDADWDRLQSVNVHGTWLGLKAAFKAMAGNPAGGTIINISSLLGLVGDVNAIAYGATKGAITLMSKSAASEGARLSQPVRVNTVHPGIIWTDMLIEQFGNQEEITEKFAAAAPLKTLGRPEHIAEAVLFLASDDSALITGSEVVVDGGLGAD